MRTNFQMILDLKDWSPEDDHMTSLKEVRMLTEHFKLDEMSMLDLQNLRDMVVLMFGNWMKEKRSEGLMNEFFKISNGMMSITAVIDNAKYSKGCEM